MNDYVEIDIIISKMYSDYLFEVTKGEIIDDIYYLMGIINNPDDYIDKFQTVNISAFRGTLPKDLYILEGVLDIDSNTTLIESGDVFNRFSTTAEEEVDTAEFTYAKKGSYIFTGIEEGEVEVSYKAIPTLNGEPAIPNDPKAIRMITANLSRIKAIKLVASGKINSDFYRIIDQEAAWTLSSYSTHCKIPSKDKMQGMVNRSHKLLENPFKQEIGFKSHGYRSGRRR